MAFVNVKALATTPDNLSLILGSQWDQKKGEMTLESCLLISISIACLCMHTKFKETQK